MKFISFNRIVLSLFSFLMIGSNVLFSQACTGSQITITFDNATRVSSTEFEFDVFLVNSGTTTLTVAAMTGSKTYAVGTLPNGGVGTYSVVTQPSQNEFPTLNNLNPSHNATARNIRWTETPVDQASSVALAGTPKKFARLRFTSSLPWNINSTELALVAVAGSGFPACQILVYCNGNPVSSTLSVGNNGLILGEPQTILLPITLHTFSAEKHSDRSAKLSWVTSKEINSSHFGIERSADGLTDWTKLGEVKAAGNSDTHVNYNFIDNTIPSNRNKDQVYYYRLQMTDMDGAFKYSDVRGVNFGLNLAEEIKLYPNPTIDKINIDLSSLDFSEKVATMNVFDFNGKLVSTKEVNGAGIELLDMQNFQSGMYNVIIKHNTDTFTYKVIKVD